MANDPNHAQIYDNITGREFVCEGVLRARHDEVERLSKMGVWKIVPKSQCKEVTGREPIRGR